MDSLEVPEEDYETTHEEHTGLAEIEAGDKLMFHDRSKPITVVDIEMFGSNYRATVEGPRGAEYELRDISYLDGVQLVGQGQYSSFKKVNQQPPRDIVLEEVDLLVRTECDSVSLQIKSGDEVYRLPQNESEWERLADHLDSNE